MAQAGKALKLAAALTDIAGDAVDGVRTCVFNRSREIIDITVFGTTTAAEARLKLAGLQDGTIDVAGTYLPADTGQARLETNFGNGADLFWQMLYDGTNGDRVQTMVESFNIDADVSRDNLFTASLSRNGTITTV